MTDQDIDTTTLATDKECLAIEAKARTRKVLHWPELVRMINRMRAAERERDALREAHYAAELRAFAYAQQIERLREALKPFSILTVPLKPQGNAGVYSLYHRDVEAVRAALEAKP